MRVSDKLYKKKISIKLLDNSVLRNFLLFKKNFYLIYHTVYKHKCWVYKKVKKK
jgi:hypothetical protein